jgi:hypothetical protein
VQGVIELAAGVYFSTRTRVGGLGGGGFGGFIIRGGRPSESATYVDGAIITDFATQRNNTDLGRFAVVEIDVVTGGFNAEFGHAQSGVVNIVTREGGPTYHGSLRFTTDGHFGTDGYTADELATDGADRNLDREKCCGFNSVQASLGGPLAGEKLMFFGSAELSAAADIDPRSGGFNPVLGRFNSAGSTETILPGSRGDRTRLQGKLTSFLTESSKINATYLFSRDQDESFAHGGGGGVFQYFSGATRVRTHDAIVGYDQRFFQTPERNLNLQVRGNWHKTEFASGVPVSSQMNAILTDFSPELAALCGSDCTDEDAFDNDFLNYRLHDITFYFEDAFFPGGVTAEQKAASGCACPVLKPLVVVPSARSIDPDPIFGVTQIWQSGGMLGGMTLQNEERWGLRVDLDSQLNRIHRAKVGVEYTTLDIDRMLGFFESTFNVMFAEPRVGAAYVQDRLDYSDLVIDLGLRLDRFDPNITFPALPGIVPCEISNFPQCHETGAESVEAEVKTEWSPRLGVAHPITDATQVRLSYGKFHQLPEMRDFYANVGTDFEAAQNNPNVPYGNPNLDYVETTAFEAGITHLISENLVLDVVAYNRDRRGAIRLDVFQPGEVTPDERRIFVNGDNGNVKGADITLSKRYSNYFATDLAWSLQWARGTTSSPIEWDSNFGRIFDPLNPGVLLPPPSELQPESFDRLHNINWSFTLRFPDDYKEGTTAGRFLRDFGVYVVYNAHSGEPWTRLSTTGQGQPLEDIGGSRLPWVHSGNLRVTKGIDILGDFGFEVFATVQNFLDVENVVFVNGGSGEPDLTGIERSLSLSPQIPVQYRTDESGPGDYPVAVSTLTEDFRDRFAQNDLDGDGVITLAEAQENLFNALVASGSGSIFGNFGDGDSPYHYGEPRQIRFGAEVRF